MQSEIKVFNLENTGPESVLKDLKIEIRNKKVLFDFNKSEIGDRDVKPYFKEHLPAYSSLEEVVIHFYGHVTSFFDEKVYESFFDRRTLTSLTITSAYTIFRKKSYRYAVSYSTQIEELFSKLPKLETIKIENEVINRKGG